MDGVDGVRTMIHYSKHRAEKAALNGCIRDVYGECDQWLWYIDNEDKDCVLCFCLRQLDMSI